MVQRATCSSESNASPDGVRISDRERRGNVATLSTGDASSAEEASLGRGTGRFSLFRWFKRSGNRDTTIEKRRRTVGKARRGGEEGGGGSACSSAESVATFYSTTTVRSFAFHAGTLAGADAASVDVFRGAADVGPFAAGATKVAGRDKENNGAASTLPASAFSRKRDLTARYSLQPSTAFNSCGNLPEPRLSVGSFKRHEDRGKGSCNGSIVRKRAHVKGKRRAPNPPSVARPEADVSRQSGNRRKRRAPKPPEPRPGKPTDGGMEVETEREAEDVQTISNDTLVLQGGVLLSKKEVGRGLRSAKDNGQSAETVHQEGLSQVPTIGTLSTAMPRPWYKRSVFEHSRDAGPSRRGDVLRGGPSSTATEMKEECAGPSAAASSSGYSGDASLSRLSFFHRGGQSEERKRKAKRKSGLSILTNISELDKEAAAIVQEEQARARASMLLKSSRFADAFERRNDGNEEIVQDMVTSAMESSSPRRGTRALISKFNAISNITKVTVNANFFAKGPKEQQPSKFERDVVRSTRLEQDWKEQLRFPVQQAGQAVQADRDISRYFPAQPRGLRSRPEATEANAKLPGTRRGFAAGKEFNEHLAAETSSRISLLQSRLAANRMTEGTACQKDASAVTEEKIRSSQEVSGERKERVARVEEAGRRQRHGTEGTEKDAAGETKRRERQRLDGVQKEFSDIFDEIDKQLHAKEFRLDRRLVAGPAESVAKGKEESGVASKVEKVLDILVEAEKGNKAKAEENSALIENTSRVIEAESKVKHNKPKPLTEDPTTTDLKEMLKEMKHSLPKRPKPKKAQSVETAEKSTPELGRTGYFVSAVTKVESIALQGDHEAEKHKVSSSVQTSGNLRRLGQPTDRPSTSGWRQGDFLCKPSGRNAEGAGLVKNTFQLIRPRELPEIDAVKTTKESPYKENTYANVIEQSLYANARVPPPPPPSSPKQRADPAKGKNVPSEPEKPPDSPHASKAKVVKKEPLLVDAEEEDNAVDRNMNTLAINRLLRKLEAAIASGHHQQAAGLAKELARLKIHCSVIRQRSARLKDRLIKVNMYIEDKLAHQGPIPLQLPTTMTVAELKAKVYTGFEIPTNVQRWIIGKNLADQDGATLEELQAVDGSAIFLYLVAPELKAENAILPEKTEAEVQPKTNEEEPTAAVVEVLEAVKENEEPVAEPQEAEERRTPDEAKMDRYEELISLENYDVIPNSEPIECPVCFVTYGPREGVILRDCLHMFCRSCLSNTIKYCEEAEVKCPYRDTEYTCESTLQEREIKALVEPEVYQQHLAKSIAQAENNAGNNAFHCKTPDCPGWCIYDDNVNNFLCPVCGANNCLTCQVIHAGKNCKQYQQELRLSKETDQESRRTAAMLEEMVDRGEALACPTCAVVLMKKWGCDWLRCSMCKTEICWVTRGPRWGPGGRGDTSGGCRCGENGVKCHPRCNYCH